MVEFIMANASTTSLDKVIGLMSSFKTVKVEKTDWEGDGVSYSVTLEATTKLEAVAFMLEFPGCSVAVHAILDTGDEVWLGDFKDLVDYADGTRFADALEGAKKFIGVNHRVIK